jgi:hypothetical protein
VSIMRFLSPASVLRLILSFRSVSKDIFDDYFSTPDSCQMGGRISSILFLSPSLFTDPVLFNLSHTCCWLRLSSIWIERSPFKRIVYILYISVLSLPG